MNGRPQSPLAITPLAVDTRPQASLGPDEKRQARQTLVDSTPKFLPSYNDGDTQQFLSAVGAWNEGVKQADRNQDVQDAKDGDILALTNQPLPSGASEAQAHAYLQATGKLAAREDTTALLKEWDTHEGKDTADFGQFAREFFGKKLEGVSSGHYRNGYAQDLPAFIDKMTVQHREQQRESLSNKSKGVLMQLFEGDLHGGAEVTPETIAGWQQQATEHGHTKDAADDLVFAAVKRAAMDSKPELLEALMSDTSPTSPYQNPRLSEHIRKALHDAETNLTAEMDRREKRDRKDREDMQDRAFGELGLMILQGARPEEIAQRKQDLLASGIVSRLSEMSQLETQLAGLMKREETPRQQEAALKLEELAWRRQLSNRQVFDADISYEQKKHLLSLNGQLRRQDQSEARAASREDREPAIFKTDDFKTTYSLLDELAMPTDLDSPTGSLTLTQKARKDRILGEGRVMLRRLAADLDPKDREGLNKVKEEVLKTSRERLKSALRDNGPMYPTPELIKQARMRGELSREEAVSAADELETWLISQKKPKGK